MASTKSNRARRAAPRLLALTGAAAVLCRWGSPTYAVKGGWQGKPSVLTEGAAKGEFGTIMEGLEPQVSMPVITYNREGVALSVEDGKLHADYTTQLDEDTTLNLRMNDDQAWIASLVGQDASLRVRGQGKDTDSLSWEAAQESSVDGVGDVKVEFNSDKAYNLTVNRAELAEIAGAVLDARVRATNDGVTGRLGARRQLPQGAEVTYSVENPVGVYELGQSKHVGRLSAPVAGGNAALEVQGGAGAEILKGSYTRPVAGGQADLRVSRDAGALGYNVSYTRSLNDLVPVDAAAQVGVDEDGLYGKLTANRDVGSGVSAYYEALARLGRGENTIEKLHHALKLSNKLGYAQLVHAKGDAPRLRVGYEFNA